MKLLKESRSKLDIAEGINITATFVSLKEFLLQFHKTTGFMWSAEFPWSNWSALFAIHRSIPASSTIIWHPSRRRFLEESVALTEIMPDYSDDEIVSAVSQECKTRPLLKEALLASLTSDPQQLVQNSGTH